MNGTKYSQEQKHLFLACNIIPFLASFHANIKNDKVRNKDDNRLENKDDNRLENKDDSRISDKQKSR